VKLERLALIAGVGLFLWLLHRIGLAAVWSSLARIGWGFAAILLLESVVVLSTTLAWRQTVPPDRPVALRSLLAMPARAGVPEGGLYAIFGALGLNPVNGFSLGLARRLRELSWGLLGLGVLAYLRRSKPGADGSARAEERAMAASGER